MGIHKFICTLVVILMIDIVCVINVNAAPIDDYTANCVSCHGQGGMGEYPLDGSYCPMETLEEILVCYPTISMHDYVEDCDDTCIEEANSYVFDVLLLQIGASQYSQMCASCHGDTGMEGAAIDGSECDLSSVESIADCYPSVSAHGSITECDDACVWNVNRYVSEVLLGGGTDEDTDTDDTSTDTDADDTSADTDAGSTDSSTDSGSSSSQTVSNGENDDWVSCFISVIGLN